MKKKCFLLVLGLLFLGTGVLQAEPRAGGAYYNYGEVLQKGILFYKAQRSGRLPENYILPYRGDSCVDDGKDVGLDLTGGWYDAGDHVKFGLPMSYSAAQLGWAIYEYREAFAQAGQLEILLDEIKWATDYFIKCHPEPDVYYYDCGYGDSDHGIWTVPETVHFYTERTSFKVDPSTPGSDIAGEVAAALAIASIIFEPTDPDYAATCLSHARELFTFGDTYRGYFPLDSYYPSGSYLDDLTWAAIWLYLKTGEQEYLDKATSIMPYTSMGGQHTHCWDDVSYGAALKLAQITKDQNYISRIEKSLDWWLPDGGLDYTPGGLAYLSIWGVLRYSTTTAFLAFVWSDDQSVGDLSKKAVYREFAEKQVNYALGDNPRNSSYVVGFGENAPVHPHHRTTHGSWLSMLEVPEFHRHILYGALVGGPNSDDTYADDIKDYTLNEVTDDYNAGFVGAIARMYSRYGGDPLENWPQPEDFHPPEGVLPEYFARAWAQWKDARNLDVLFQLNNRSACPPTVRDNMSARYFLDLSELYDAGYTEADVTLTLKPSDDGGMVSELKHWDGNYWYFEVTFPGVLIHPGGWNDCEKDATVRIYRPLDGGYEKDWSYQGMRDDPDYNARTFEGMTEYISVYDNGVYLSGLEPPSNLTPTPTPVVTPGPQLLMGDVNGDKKINIVDALMTAQFYVGLEPSPFNEQTADVNKDGSVNIVDALKIAQFYVGLISEF